MVSPAEALSRAGRHAATAAHPRSRLGTAIPIWKGPSHPPSCPSFRRHPRPLIPGLNRLASSKGVRQYTHGMHIDIDRMWKSCRPDSIGDLSGAPMRRLRNRSTLEMPHLSVSRLERTLWSHILTLCMRVAAPSFHRVLGSRATLRIDGPTKEVSSGPCRMSICAQGRSRTIGLKSIWSAKCLQAYKGVVI